MSSNYSDEQVDLDEVVSTFIFVLILLKCPNSSPVYSFNRLLASSSSIILKHPYRRKQATHGGCAPTDSGESKEHAAYLRVELDLFILEQIESILQRLLTGDTSAQSSNEFFGDDLPR